MKGKEAPPDKDPHFLYRTLHPQKDYPLVCGFVRQRAENGERIRDRDGPEAERRDAFFQN